jgi:hypothetical protein
MKWDAPMLLKLIVLARGPFQELHAADAAKIECICCDATHDAGGSMSHDLSY